MSLQLIGLNSCASCDADALVWTCPVCDTRVEGEAGDDNGEVVNFLKLHCGGCGADREVVTYVVPESLTDFWVHDVRSGERIAEVEFSEAMGRPMTLHFGRRVVRVTGMVFFVRVESEGPAMGATPYGAYVLRTDLGLCVVVSVPQEIGGGEVAAGISDWYLVEADGAMRERLRGHRRARGGGELGGSTVSGDEDLLRNSYAYRIVYRLENALRVLVGSRLQKKAGGVRRWWKAVVPEALRKRVEEVKARRRGAAWFEIGDGEPIELTTLGELIELLEDDWSSLGGGLGSKNVIVGALGKLEFYRNELAHCRPLTLGMLSDLHNVERSLRRIRELADG